MEILRWYGIIFMGFNMILQMIGLVFSNELDEKLKCFVGIIFTIPIMIFLLIA